MKHPVWIVQILLIVFLLAEPIKAEIFIVNSQQTFNSAQSSAIANDSIIWESGTFSDIYMNITKSNLYIGALVLGGTVFNGESRVRITSDYIKLRGLQFVGGDIGTDDVINTAGSYNHFDQINIRGYRSYKYLVIRESCQYVDVTYCNFENRLNLDDKNILSVLVDNNNPGYHKIQHCSFKNFAGTGNDLGIEPIRIGLSTQANRISRTLVEYCYFTECDGDGELISSKATQNVYRYNTFENNSKAELVLRHGSQAVVYGNFFLNGKGGVRVREGQDHYIYNNYFEDLDDRAIYLQNEDSDPLDNINIAFNTFVSCSEIILGGDGDDKPTQVSFANNIFDDPDDDIFEDATGTETWIGNIAQGSLGISLPSNGLTLVNPQLIENSNGLFALSPTSPAIDAAIPGYDPLPSFPGIDDVDLNVLFDIMGQSRPSTIQDKDLGCHEFPHDVLIQPIATEANTGPDYNTSILTNSIEPEVTLENWVSIFPNPASESINLTMDNPVLSQVEFDVLDTQGRIVKKGQFENVWPGSAPFTQDIQSLPSGRYLIQVLFSDDAGALQKREIINLIKL